ncbi:glycosyltransferase family 2 protein [Flavobacterium pallidum]|uniref:Glycosyltransferase family 2 protein n=1 Tax=Flavobacterium pallidum TaxID=2172098 RepID=A0A2S1SKS9_9FLAO|nr:glycosyltransferase family A protein [Flavobacterium pallidum]AWI27013.1 glycosyltransferase family 2 protein [Flavobacterium pallidum]
MPFFSVIIPLYNKESFIEDTIKSVLKQTFTDFELIIVNDGSIDQSAEKAQAFTDSRIRYFSKTNEGVSVARNFGIDIAQADYISFLDADDYWYPDFLATMKNNISAFPGHRVFSAAIEIETALNTFPAQYTIPKTTECIEVDFFEASSKECVIWTSCAVFHKSVFEKAGRFDPKLKSVQDTDLWIRIGLLYPVIFCWKILARYVFDAGSLSKESKYITEKLHFEDFAAAEKSHSGLKKFLDLNRYSLAIKSKLKGDMMEFKSFADDIDRNGLPLKKRILLSLPGFLLKKLILLQVYLADKGLGSSVFK